jgi:integrase
MTDTTLVFSTAHETPLSDTNLPHRHLKPAGQKIGAPWLNWHTLRRTRATLLQLAGGTLKDAQAQLGHTKLSTTLEVYTLPVPSHQRAAVENLAQMVTSRTSAWRDGRQQRSKLNELNGRPEWTRTIDLFRVKEAL